MRLSPSASRLVWTAGYEVGRPVVTLGADRALAPGHDPRFASEGVAVFGDAGDGPLMVARSDNGWAPRSSGTPNGNWIAAGGGRWAVGRTDPRRVILSSGRVILGATECALSDDGEWIAVVRPDVPRDGFAQIDVERWDGSGHRVLHAGSPRTIRMGGTTLCWEEVGGTVYGIADVANPSAPVTNLTLDGELCYKPVPVWHEGRGELLVLMLRDRGIDAEAVVREWAQPVGWPVTIATGSAYDHDIRPVVLGAAVRVAWLPLSGKQEIRDLGLSAPRVRFTAPPRETEADFEYVADGTLVRDAFTVLFGAQPVQSGDLICIHKNIDQAEYRRVVTEGGRRLAKFWFDASRVPGDPGWWIEPDPTWAADEFRSGESFVTDNAQIVDLRPGVPPNRWRQTIVLYGLKGDGVGTLFDPRFPGMYVDFSKVGTAGYEPQGYERFYNLRDGRVRWEFWGTPIEAKGVLPWGDRSMDRMIRRVDDRARPGGPPPPPFKPCPRTGLEDDVNPPAVSIETYGTEIRNGQPWKLRVSDSNNPGTVVEVEIVNGSLYVKLANARGADRSGKYRPIAVRG